VLIGGVRRASGAVLAPHNCPAWVTEERRGRSKTANHEMYAMQSTELIRQFLHERVGTPHDQVVNEALLADLGVDSLMLAELMFEAEDRLGISIDSNVTIPKTVGNMVQLIDTLLASKATKAAQS
jgi:acyl carrier protein